MRFLAPSAAASVLLAASLLSSTATSAEAGGQNACSRWANISGFSDSLDKTTFEGAGVGELSGFAFDTNGRLLAVADESSLFTLDPRTKKPLALQTLVDETGQPVDSEAVAVDRDGTRLVTSETEPSILRFSRSGKALGRLQAPAPLRVAPAGRATRNLTFEGMTLQPGDRTLVASMEGAISGDNADIRRFQTWHRTRGEFRLAAQYAYGADAGLNISDITAAGDGRLLVLERGYTSGVGNTVRVYLADFRHASDVSGVENVTGQPDVKPAHKTLIADIGECPSLGATTKQPQPNPLLDNIEGITVTGRTRDGRLNLLLVSDDNGNATQITRLYYLSALLPRR